MADQEPRALFGAELELGDDDRRRLGLAPGESARLIHAGGRMLLLERTRSEGDEALPWDRDLVLSVDVRAFPLADVLRLVHDAGKSGYLAFNDGEVEKAIFLSRGEVVFATSNQLTDRLGECLLRAGIINLCELEDAEKRWKPNQRFGKLLVEKGVLTPRELWNGVKLQVEEIVRSLFTYTSGQVHVWEGTVQPDNVVRLSLPTRRLVSEGLARRDDLLKLVACLEDPRTRIALVDPDAARRREGNERRLLDALEVEPRFTSLCRQTGLDPLSAARSLRLLSLAGVVVVAPEEDAVVGSPSSSQDAVRECVLQHLKLLSELAAPLVATESFEAVGQRLARVMAETAERYPQLLHDLPLGPGGVPDVDVLTERALRLPGDRERAVGMALGELVAYLEFEVKNSPHIDEPDPYLEAVDALRAGLAY